MFVKEITDKSVWESFIADVSPQSFFQSWGAGEVENRIFSQDSKRKLYRYGLYSGTSLLGVWSVKSVKAKRGTFLHIRHGPIFRTWNKDTLEVFLKHIKGAAKANNASFVRVSPLVEKGSNGEKLLVERNFHDAPIHSMDGELCLLIDVTKSEDAILQGMRKNTRNLIRKAQKIGVVIKKSKRSQDLKLFEKLYKETAKRQGFVAHKGIREEFDQFLKDDQILLYLGYYKRHLYSVSLIVFYNNQGIYHHSASRVSNFPVNYLLQWEAIRETKQRGCRVYNMWGIADEKKKRHPWKGLTLFKKGFGGEVKEYMHAKDLLLSYKYCATYMIETLRKMKKGY